MISFVVVAIICFTSEAHTGPRVRHKCPDFSGASVLPDLSFGTVSLSSLLNHGNRWALLLFYPAAWTFVCPTELIAFSDSFAEFERRNVSVAFVSVDTKYVICCCGCWLLVVFICLLWFLRHSLLAWLHQPRSEGGLGGVPFRVPLVSDVTRQVLCCFCFTACFCIELY
jgi:peroxiredoxin (alkyl hydroperoxide reductase subunit C)